MSALTTQIETGGDDDSDSSESEADEPKKNAKKGKQGTKENSGVYVPPKLSAVHYDGEDSKAERARKQMERARKRALKYELILCLDTF